MDGGRLHDRVNGCRRCCVRVQLADRGEAFAERLRPKGYHVLLRDCAHGPVHGVEHDVLCRQRQNSQGGVRRRVPQQRGVAADPGPDRARQFGQGAVRCSGPARPAGSSALLQVPAGRQLRRVRVPLCPVQPHPHYIRRLLSLHLFRRRLSLHLRRPQEGPGRLQARKRQCVVVGGRDTGDQDPPGREAGATAGARSSGGGTLQPDRLPAPPQGELPQGGDVGARGEVYPGD
mmetsp:Transcript_40191/g.104759  ORF Transcript_40191/g.104759 Transcript_40191/m.104759 type:complete len:232 (-) Transcript_40191:1800-2495(-)